MSRPHRGGYKACVDPPARLDRYASSKGAVAHPRLFRSFCSSSVWLLLLLLVLPGTAATQSPQSFTFGTEFLGTSSFAAWDRVGRNFETQLNLGVFKPKMDFVRFNSDDMEAHTVTSEGILTLDLSVLLWPTLTLTYTRREEEETSRVARTVLGNVSSNTVGAMLWYGGQNWEGYASSSYSFNKDQLSSGLDTTSYYTLGGSYQPTEAFNINPSMEFTREFHGFSGVRSNTLYGYLGLDYSILEGLMTFSVSGSYTADKTSDGYDAQRFDGSIELIRKIGNALGFPNNKATLSFLLNYSRNIELNYLTNQEDYSTLFRLEMTP